MCIFGDAAWQINCSAGLMDLAINMKAVLVASYFTALSLQVKPFFSIPPSVSGGKEWRITWAGGPWRWKRELWVRGREGDRLAGERGERCRRRGQAGRRQDHQHQVRPTSKTWGNLFFSGYFLLWLVGTSMASQARCPAVVRFKRFLMFRCDSPHITWELIMGICYGCQSSLAMGGPI